MAPATDGLPAPRRGRKPPTSEEKIAALLLMYWDAKGEPIPFEIAKQMTAAQICSLVQWDHAVYHTWGGSTHPTNITPRAILAHREKTATRDVPAIAKVRRGKHRLADEYDAAQGRGEVAGHGGNRGNQFAKVPAGNDATAADLGLSRKDIHEAPAWLEPPRPARPKRKMRGQGFRGWRKFDGTVVWADQRGRT